MNSTKIFEQFQKSVQQLKSKLSYGWCVINGLPIYNLPAWMPYIKECNVPLMDSLELFADIDRKASGEPKDVATFELVVDTGCLIDPEELPPPSEVHYKLPEVSTPLVRVKQFYTPKKPVTARIRAPYAPRKPLGGSPYEKRIRKPRKLINV
jgi:hypothetical protein